MLFLDMVFWPNFWVYAHNQSVSLLNGLYLLHFVQNLAKSATPNWFVHLIKSTSCDNCVHPLRMAPTLVWSISLFLVKYTVSLQQEAMRLIFESGHGVYLKNDSKWMLWWPLHGTHHLPIYIHLQAMAYPMNFFPTNISLTQTKAAKLLIRSGTYGTVYCFGM